MNQFASEFLTALERQGHKTRQSRANFCKWSYAYQQYIEEGKKVPGERALAEILERLPIPIELAQDIFISAAIARSDDRSAKMYKSILARLGGSASTGHGSDSALDVSALTESAKLVEQYVELSGEPASPERRARMLVLIYEYWISNRTANKSQLLKLIVNNV